VPGGALDGFMRGRVPDLLFISHRIPWPLNKGEKTRGWNLIQHMRATGWRVHLGCLVDDPADMAHIDVLRAVCADVGAFRIDRRAQKLFALLRARPGRPLMPDFYCSSALQQWVDAKLAAVPMDVLYIYSVAMAPYVLEVPHGRKILDAQDIDSEKWAEYANGAPWPMRAVWAREARTLFAYERRVAAVCEWTFFVTEAEAKRFCALAPEVASKVTYVECGVDIDRFSPVHVFDAPFAGPGPHLVFTGNMDYWPNADAAIWFATEVMPVLRARRPNSVFYAVGANPGPDVRRLAELPGIVVTGRVPDTRPYIAHADAIVCPLRIARGIQNKVLEGMAMGRTVIASSAAFEGLRAEAGRELLVADGVMGFAAAIESVLSGAHPGLGAAARGAMVMRAAWTTVLRRLDSYLVERKSGDVTACVRTGAERPQTSTH
jgi:sugar transferase (PEP-CTERM/EpsH1 system associated)